MKKNEESLLLHSMATSLERGRIKLMDVASPHRKTLIIIVELLGVLPASLTVTSSLWIVLNSQFVSPFIMVRIPSEALSSKSFT